MTEAAGFRERIAAGQPVQVIAFAIGGEVHACDVLLVEEVVTNQRVHPLPDMPARLLGVLRLRGELVPVIDVAPLLDLALGSARAPAVMVVDTGAGRVGVAADAVQDVVTVPPSAYRPAPVTVPGQEGHTAALAQVGPRLINLVDLAELLREHTKLSLGESQ
jgi:chemotaxis signal transduction protein